MRVGKGEALRRKFGIETLLKVKEDRPIVIATYPDTHHKRDVIRVKRFERYKRCRYRVHTIIDGRELVGGYFQLAVQFLHIRIRLQHTRVTIEDR